MNKGEICKNCKYHYIEEISFDYPQSICNKDEKVGYTTEQGLSCDDFTYSKEYVKAQQQELESRKNKIDEIEKWLTLQRDNLDKRVNEMETDDKNMTRANHYTFIYNRVIDKLKELKGSDN